MVEKDTIRLLRECDAGVKMGVKSMDEVIDYMHSENFRQILINYKSEHTKLGNEIQTLLDIYHDEGKNPNPVAAGMSWVKTNMKLAVDESDQTIADLMTDGCHMGIKSLNRYLNQYESADEKSRDIARKLIHLEEELVADIREYL